MLARLGKRGASAIQRPILTPSQLRTVFSGPKFLRAAPIIAQGAVEEKKEEDKSILGVYGLYPLLGLGAVAIVSKELLVMNTDFAVAVNFGLTTTVLWFAVGDMVSAEYTKWIQEREKAVNNVNQLYVEGLEQASSILKSATVGREFTEDAAQHAEKSFEALVAAQNRQLRHDARAAVIAKLELLRAGKRAEEAKLKKALLLGLEPFIVDRYKKDKNLRAQELDVAIDRMSADVESGRDTLKRLLIEYVEGSSGSPKKSAKQ